MKLGGDLIGSVYNAASAKASSVIMAFWPGTNEELRSTDSSRMRVGVVQYFLKHQAVILNESNERSSTNMEFAYVFWKQKHPQEDWYGNSALVCFDMFEPHSPCNFIPVQWIAKKCASCVHNLEIIPSVQENVFVACPISIKYSL